MAPEPESSIAFQAWFLLLVLENVSTNLLDQDDPGTRE